MITRNAVIVMVACLPWMSCEVYSDTPSDLEANGIQSNAELSRYHESQVAERSQRLQIRQRERQAQEMIRLLEESADSASRLSANLDDSAVVDLELAENAMYVAVEAEKEAAVAPATEGGEAAAKGDKTGTNPVNFTFDLRISTEHQWLNTAGDGDQNVTVLEFRAPIFDGKVQFRVRARVINLQADLNNNGVDNVDDFGFGDVDFRFLIVPYLNMKQKMAIATGIEVSLDTASEDAIGSGATSLGPQAFLVFFKPFNLSFIDLIAPAYQHKFSVAGSNDVNQSLIDIFFLKTSADKTFWALVDPQIIIDHETDKEFVLLDIEGGLMMDKYLGTKGHSIFVRPSIGIGGDRPYDVSIEFGYKMVW